MKKQKKRWCDRHDGVRVKVPGVLGLINYIKPKRSESEVYILKKFDVTDTLKFVEKKEKEYAKEDQRLTIFYVFAAAMAKTVYLRPRLNRFVINKRFYDRNEVSFGFVGKTTLDDSGDELFQCIKVDEKDKLLDIVKKSNKKIKALKKNEKNSADSLISVIAGLPGFIKTMFIGLVRFADNHDLLPKSLTDNLIYHVTVLITNLGSIKCGGIYHNLTNFGTNSIIVAIGEIKEENILQKDGSVVTRSFVEVGFTLDERNCDGFYYAKSVRYFEWLLHHPEKLEEEMKEGIEFEC